MGLLDLDEPPSLRDYIHVLRRLARDIRQRRDDPEELGFDLEDMQRYATESPDRFVRELAVRFLTRHSFEPSRDPRRTTLQS